MQTLISFLPYRVRVLVKLFFATFCSTPKSTRCFSWFFSSIFFFASRLFGRRSQWCAMWHIVQRHIGCSTKRNEIQLDDNNFLWTQIIFIGYIWMDMDRTCSIGIAYYDLSVNLVWLFSSASVRPISCSLFLLHNSACECELNLALGTLAFWRTRARHRCAEHNTYYTHIYAMHKTVATAAESYSRSYRSQSKQYV